MKFYLFCPWYISGGPECIHQYCSELNNAGYDSYIVYDNESLSVIPEYKKYNVKSCHYPIDDPNNVIIIPETYEPSRVDNYKNSILVYYWLSKDNVGWNLADPKLYNIKWHVCQSVYAYNFVVDELKLNKNYVMMLTDFTRDIFIEDEKILINNFKHKQNNILFNPSKGFEYTNHIINFCHDIGANFIPLQGYTPDQIKELAQKSKIYIDFGHHPGKDRIPREMVSCGCCMLVGKKGSADVYGDVPIESDRKIDLNNFFSELDKIKIILQNDLNNYETNFYSFFEYREAIRNEKNKFKKEIINFVEKIKMDKFYNTDLGINSKHLYDIVNLQKNSIFVDLGVRVGVSSEIMLSNSEKNNNRVYGIDVDFSLIDKNILNNKNYTPILGDSVTVGKEWNNFNKVKILFVDTFHIKEQVLCELYYWFNHMDNDSYIVFHDSHWPEGKHDFYGGIIWDRVEEAIKEYFKLYELENISRDDIDVKCYPESHGMTFIHIKNKNNFKQNSINWNYVFERRNKLISMFWNEENISNVKLELNILPK